MRMSRFYSILTGVFLTLNATAEEQRGTWGKPLRMYIIPQGQIAKTEENAKPVIKCIEKETKLNIELKVPNNYVTVAEALGSNNADVAFSNVLGYFLMTQKYGAKPLFKVARYGTTDYQSFIIVKSSSKIKSIKDLDGKTFAYGDAGSLTSYTLPKLEMKKQHVKLAQEFSTGNMEASIMAVMQGKADAAAAYYNDPDPKTGIVRDARERLLSIYPNIVNETNIIWKSEYIPNEPIVLRDGISKEIEDKLVKAMPMCFRKHALLINDIDDLLPISPDDKSYDKLLELLKKSDLDIAKVLNEPKKKK